jgi:mannose/fructose/N-acetylgalactosamine-specific phosphotransferase system component IID
MNTLYSKITTLAAALAMNGLIMAGVIYLFALQAHPHLSAISFARQIVAHQWLS